MADLKIRIKAVTQGLDKGLQGAKSKLKGFGAAMGRSFTIGKAGAAALVGSFVALISKITMAGAKFEQTSVAFTTMLGNAERANKVLDKLAEFSTKTPFEPDEVFKAAKTLMAFGATAEETTEIIKRIGDVSAGSGKDLNELARIYGKVFVKGKAQAEELNQFSEAGIPIIKELQKQYNATASEIFKMGSQGKISFNDIDQAFRNMTSEGGIFFNAMENQSETLSGKWSTLKGNAEQLQIALAKLEGPKKLLDWSNELLKNLTEIAKETNVGKDQNVTTMDVIGEASRRFMFGTALTDQDDTFVKQYDRAITRGEAKKWFEQQKRIKDQSSADAAQRKAEAKARDGQSVMQGTLQSINRDQALSVGQMLTPVSAAQVDAQLTELQKQTETLEQIRERVGRRYDDDAEKRVQMTFKDGA